MNVLPAWGTVILLHPLRAVLNAERLQYLELSPGQPGIDPINTHINEGLLYYSLDLEPSLKYNFRLDSFWGVS